MEPTSTLERTVRRFGRDLTGAWNFVVEVLKLHGEARARRTLEIYHPEIARASTARCKIATPPAHQAAAKSPATAGRKLVAAHAGAGA